MKTTRFVARLAAVAMVAVPAGLWAQKPKPAAPAVSQPAALDAQVFLNPTCGCCKIWVKHLADAGFTTRTEVTTALEQVPARQKVPAAARSCHTAVVGPYVIEGHVHADAIKRLIKEAPQDVIGLAVPNMPVGSPGMEGPNPRPYSILALKRDGSSYEFERR